MLLTIVHGHPVSTKAVDRTERAQLVCQVGGHKTRGWILTTLEWAPACPAHPDAIHPCECPDDGYQP